MKSSVGSWNARLKILLLACVGGLAGPLTYPFLFNPAAPSGWADDFRIYAWPASVLALSTPETTTVMLACLIFANVVAFEVIALVIIGFNRLLPQPALNSAVWLLPIWWIAYWSSGGSFAFIGWAGVCSAYCLYAGLAVGTGLILQRN